MYFIESATYEGSKEVADLEYRLGRRLTPEERIGRAASGGIKLTKKQFDEAKDYDGHAQRLCERADDLGLLHAYNDTWLEVRTWNNDMRGILTLLALFGLWLFWGQMVFGDWADVISLYRTGLRASGAQLIRSTPLSWMLNTVATTAFAGGVTWVSYRFILRYEWPAQRWIRLRFNRKTKKVYLLRPKYAGGLQGFDWQQTQPDLPSKLNPSDPLLFWGFLGWRGKELGRPSFYQFVGRRTSFQTMGDWMAFWEFIRRFMEEGPESLPEPRRLIGSGPSLREAWISITQWFPLFSQKSFTGSFSDGLTFLLSPLILLIVAGNFVGQCLTWQARFPKEVENAGKE